MKKQIIFTDEPFYACLDCSHRRASRCKGPNTSAMTLLEWCKFIRALKEAEGLTNMEIAKGADVSVKTIEKIMALNVDQDIMRDTARRIENFVMGAASSYPCYLAFEENVPEVSQKLNEALRELERNLADSDEDHRKVLDNIHASHTAEIHAIKTNHNLEIQAIKDEADRKLQYMQAMVERLHREKDNLWAENTRKSRIIDRLIELQETAAKG